MTYLEKLPENQRKEVEKMLIEQEIPYREIEKQLKDRLEVAVYNDFDQFKNRNKAITPVQNDDGREKFLEHSQHPVQYKSGMTSHNYAEAIKKILNRPIKLSLLDDCVYIGETRLTDNLTEKLTAELSVYGYKSANLIKTVVSALAKPFNPVVDSIEQLPSWDGVDSISYVCNCLTCVDDSFSIYFPKWLLGSLNRILGTPQGGQNPVLVLDGKQGIGKSKFVEWVGSWLPAEHFKAGSINPDDKDCRIDSTRKFIMELSELGATTRRADIEALKSFFSREIESYRVPYGRLPITKPVICNYCATINNTAGFLSDSTGSRRYRTATITFIDFDYANIDIRQLWAQALYLYKSGVNWLLTPEQQEEAYRRNDKYEIIDPLENYLDQVFVIDSTNKDSYYPAGRIPEKLIKAGAVNAGSDMVMMKRIAGILQKRGCTQKVYREGGIIVRGWQGVELRNTVETGY